MNIEDAYAFLKEGIWLLKDSGFGVMVPAWWDSKGMRAQQIGIRLHLGSRTSSQGPTPGEGLLGTTCLMEYDWELALGDIAISKEDWERLVALKVPLVQIRGGCLADDMGLGKTIQVIALLLKEREDSPQGLGPSLVICPTSVVGNWMREVERFAPLLKVLVHHGSKRERGESFISQANTSDVVITSQRYPGEDEGCGRYLPKRCHPCHSSKVKADLQSSCSFSRRW